MARVGAEYLKRYGNNICIGADVLPRLAGLVAEGCYERVLIVADVNTEPIAGQRLRGLLAGLSPAPEVRAFVFPENPLVPDETAVGKLVIAAEPGTDFIVALGSGTINDLCRYVSHRLSVPYAVVATAPSMDGYASGVSPLIANGLKVTYNAAAPCGIICDHAILKTAPALMFGAGVGDILGKYNCLCDWKLSRVITGEVYAEDIAGITLASVEMCMAAADGLESREDGAVNALTEALVLSGIAMKLAGSSRPASGSEHHLSHFWEMMFLFAGKPAVLHGVKVGVASLVMKRLHSLLLDEDIDWDAALRQAEGFSFDAYAKEIDRIYGMAAPAIIAEERASGRNAEGLERVALYRGLWPEITGTIREGVPSYEYMEGILLKSRAPVTPGEIGVDRDTFINGVIYAKELRARFTVLQIAGDLGLLPTFAERLADEYYG